MKKTLLVLAASLLPLTLTQTTAKANFFDSNALSYIQKAYDAASEVYAKSPTTESYYAAYFAYYSAYYFYYGVYFNDNTNRYYGYVYASYAYYYASAALKHSPNDGSALSVNLYRAYLYTYSGYYLAYYAYAGF